MTASIIWTVLAIMLSFIGGAVAENRDSGFAGLGFFIAAVLCGVNAVQ